MSEHLDEILADVAGTAAGQATAPGAGAARIRGKQRRAHRQLTVTALGLALLGLVGAVAATAVHGTSGPLVPATGSSATGPASAAPTTGVSPTVAPNPSEYVPGAWLSEPQLPYAGTITWQVNPQALGTDLHGAVQLVKPDSSFFDSSVDGFGTYCAIPALADGAIADQVELFYGPITGSSLPNTPGIPATVSQSTVFYRNQNGATKAWGAIGSGFASCAKFATGFVSGESTTYPSVGTARRIVNEPNVQCWTNLAAVSNTGPGVTDLMDDVCFVRQGTLISIVDVGFEGPPALSEVDFRTVDATTVSELRQALNVYGGG